MTNRDDRAESREHTQNQAVALGQDKAIFEQALQTLVALDAYDYYYLWTWMGVPIIQLPADLLATQEIILATRPDIIIETGVARGGSVIFMASMLRLLGAGGKVIRVDIDIRAHNRESIEKSIVGDDIILIEDGSTEAATLEGIKGCISANARVMVVMDSDHSCHHVLAECRVYGPLVTKGCYLVVADTILGHVIQEQAPKKRSKLLFKGDEPLTALNLYLEECHRFEPDAFINGKLVLRAGQKSGLSSR